MLRQCSAERKINNDIKLPLFVTSKLSAGAKPIRVSGNLLALAPRSVERNMLSRSAPADSHLHPRRSQDKPHPITVDRHVRFPVSIVVCRQRHIR